MPYLNSVVFYRDLDTFGLELTPLPPRAMAAALERGDLDAGPLPLAEVLRLGELVQPIGDFCIATRGRVDSVLLISKVPAAQLATQPIAVTSHTATSIQLLRVLFADHWRVRSGAFVELDEPHTAKLVIGDEALRLRRPTAEYQYVYDLSAEWQDLTGLPFVFAVWTARASVDQHNADQLAAVLGRSVETGLSELRAVAGEYANHYMTESDIFDYIRSFTYRLGAPERRAIEEFKSRLSRLPAWRPSVLAAAKGA